MTDMTVKFAEGSDTIIQGYGVPFGRDLDGQRFESDTNRCHDWFPKGGRPFLYDHGFKKQTQLVPIGRELTTTPDEIGDFVRGELDKANKYYEAVAQLIRDGKVGFSSGAPDHKVKIAKDGKIEVWPVVEYSLTTTPAFPNKVAYAMKSATAIEHLEGADIAIPEPLRESPLKGIAAAGKQLGEAIAEGIEQAHGGDTEPVSLADQSDQVLGGLKAWVERMEERSEARIKAGRELSRANLDSLREAHRIIGELLTRADKPSTDEAEASKSSLELALALTET